MIKRQLLVVLILILIFGCKNDDDSDCSQRQSEYVTSVEGASNGKVNEPIDINIEFFVYNGCGQFGKFIETRNGNIWEIEIEALYEGCICTTDIRLRTAVYEFIPNNTGEFQLRFKSGPEEFIDLNITINDKL